MAKVKPYKARTLKGAQQMVRWHRATIQTYEEICQRQKRELELLAKLAATGPAFYNPLEAMEAQNVRDRILRIIGRNPDGSPA